MASESEAILRAKAVSVMREAVPDGRLIHELALRGSRLDLAIVGPDAMIVAEVKSDLDCLDRLPTQMRDAHGTGATVWLFCGDRHREGLKKMRAAGAIRYGRTEVFFETPDGVVREFGAGFPRLLVSRESWRLLNILMKPELMALAQPFGGRSRMTCDALAEIIHENMTGGDVRRAVYAALRRRRFWKADRPVTP